MLELEPPGFGSVKIEPALFELPDPPLTALPEPALLEPLLPLLLPLLEPLEPLVAAPLDDDPAVVGVGAVAALCVSPQALAKMPIAAVATATRRPRRAARRAAGGCAFPPAENDRAGVTCRPAVASVTSPSGSATQLST